MSYVCLWSPSWPIGADFPADLVASLLGVAPRVAVGERGLVWGDARGLLGAPLAEKMLRIASDYGFDDAHAGVAMTPVAAEVAATQSTAQLVVVKLGRTASFIAPYPLAVLSPDEHLAELVHRAWHRNVRRVRRARRRSDRSTARDRRREALEPRPRRR